MKKYLLKLADTLDKLGLSGDANMVDYYIAKAAQEDDFSEFASDVVSDEITMKGDISISLPSGEAVINVFKNPLGQKLRVYAEELAKLFNEDRSKRTGQISVRQVDDIVDTFKTYNNDLTPAQVHWSQNEKLIYPQTVGQVVKSVGSFVYHNSPFGIDSGLYIDALEDIEAIYNDFYMEDYLGQEFDPAQYSREIDQWRSDPKNLTKERERELKTQQWAKQQRGLAQQKERERQMNRLREIDPKIFQEDTEIID